MGLNESSVTLLTMFNRVTVAQLKQEWLNGFEWIYDAFTSLAKKCIRYSIPKTSFSHNREYNDPKYVSPIENTNGAQLPIPLST